jgi:hypothetical protein
MAYSNSHLVLSLHRKSNIAEVCQRRGDKNKWYVGMRKYDRPITT